jgi:hypothetical protein
MSDGPPSPDVFFTTSGTLKKIPVFLAAPNYTHFWTDTLRSNVAAGWWQQQNKDAFNATTFAAGSDGANANTLFRYAYNAYANLIWSPVPQTNFGIEYQHDHGQLVNGRSGDLNIVQLSAQFKF